MHSFLKAIGFSNIKTRSDVEQLISYILEESSDRRVYKTKEGVLFSEMSMEFAQGAGITLRGEYDAQGKFHLEHYFPYVRGNNVSVREEVFISKRVDTDAYTGMCDDYRLGVSLIFYLQNVIQYMEKSVTKYIPAVYPVKLAALALDGKVLLPTMKDEKLARSIKAEANHRTQLIAEAKKGNQDAIDSLTIDDIDLYATVSKRIQTEDIYSIVDTSFIPYGSESDNYTVLGTITDCRTSRNERSGEEVYLLSLVCNQIPFELCINKKDLYGEPAIGRRFRGTIWMQGYTDFFGEL
ncbi:MAG: DUF3881 family protein [Lachnospiraceae bacterium]|nr:DUF3881 family protein [Lachnospiraceae bacterium]